MTPRGVLPWVLSPSRREWRLFLPLDPAGRGPRAAVVSRRVSDGKWVARVDAIRDRPAALSEPFSDVEDAVRWAEEHVDP